MTGGRFLKDEDVLVILVEEVELEIDVIDVGVVVDVVSLCVDTVDTPVCSAGALVLMMGFLSNS